MSLFKRGELKLLWNFYIYLLFWTFSLMIQPYTFVYFRDLGFSYTQIASFTSVMMISLFVFEVPTGIVADLFGRKKSVFIGLMITGVAPIIISFTSSYFLILLCYILIGLGITFISGAEEALIVDNLKYHKRDDLIKEYYIKMSSLMGLGTVIAYLLGSLIVKNYGIWPLWIIWGSGYLLSAILLIFIKEHGFKKANNSGSYLSQAYKPVKKSFKYILKNRGFFNYLIASSMITIMFVQKDLWNVLLVDIGLKRSSLSLIASITAFIIIFLPWFTKAVKSIKKALIVTTTVRIIILISVFFINSSNLYFGVVLFIIIGSITSFDSPLTSTYIQNQISSDNRATMGSLMSMVYSILGALAGILIGVLSDVIGIQLTIALFAVFGIISLFFYRGMSYSNKREESDEI